MQTSIVDTKTQMRADFRPFQAIRYNTDKVRLDDVIAPPYDIISSDGQTQLYKQSPYNCIRLILNKIEESDTPANNRYTRANDCYSAWQKENVLIQEQAPCFYLYKQTFTNPADGKRLDRFALLGRIHLEPFEKGIVVPHEKTLAKPRADRRQLLEATQTNFSPVFGLYDDETGQIAALQEKTMKDKPLYEAKDPEGVWHGVWKIQNTQDVEKIHGFFKERNVYIADGHHRYQTGLEYARDKRREQNIAEGKEMPFDFNYMAMVSFQDPGIVLLPTHRMVLPFDGFDPAASMPELQKYFKVEEMMDGKLIERMKYQKPEGAPFSRPVTFGLFIEDHAYLLTLKDAEGVKKLMPAGKPDVWYQLDLNILGYFIFARLWNLPDTAWENSLRFTRYAEEAQKSVRTRQAKASVLLEAPHVELLREMGQVQQLMPQKSTYFHPKLASGLLFYSHK